jgi:hypothetical protein
MSLEDRVARLERENRWTKGVAVALALALGVVLFVAAGQDQEKDKAKVLEEVRARKFIVVAEDGTPRGSLAGRMAGACLVIHSREREAGICLWADESTAWDEETLSEVACHGAGLSLGSRPDCVSLQSCGNGPGLVMDSELHEASITLYGPDGPVMEFRDHETGKVRFQAPK